MYRSYVNLRLIIYILIISTSLPSCGNLINDEVLDSSENINHPERVREFKTVYNNKISTSGTINLETKYHEYAVSGSIINDSNIENIWLCSIDETGDKLFESTINSNKNGRVVTQITDSDENFILVCNELDPVTSESDVLVFKLSPDRSIKWLLRLGSTSSTIATAAVQLTSGIISVLGQSYDAALDAYIPIIISINPFENSISSTRLDFYITSLGKKIYPVPVKIISDNNDTLTIAGYYRDSFFLKNRIAVIKIDASMNLISRYILTELTKHLTIHDIIKENNNMDILLISKSNILFGRDEGFTILKVFKNSTIKFENDYMIDGFSFSDNFITGSEGEFSVGGFTRNNTSNYSIGILRFNYAGNIKGFITVETDISDINKIIFSKIAKKSFLSYVYSQNKISDYIDSRLVFRRVFTAGSDKNVNKDIINIKSGSRSNETLNPVEMGDVTVTIENFDEIIIKPYSGLNIEWK